MKDSIHREYLEKKLGMAIKKKGSLKVGINLNEYFTFEDANKYAEKYASKFDKKSTNDKARQSKSSKDSILGKLVEECIVYLLNSYFKENKLNYLATNNKNDDENISHIVNSLYIIRKSTNHKKEFDSDIVIINKDNFEKDKRAFILSAKGTTRERIGQFLSHLFLMDQDVLNVKYGKNKYVVKFTEENLQIKYGFVTFDWARNRDFDKYGGSGKIRKTVKQTEVMLVVDDVKFSGGLHVLNNYEHLDKVGNFSDLVGIIGSFLK
ncbi:MAG: hypothetical protein BWK75_06905 [Candidatus Altiarchaeales archaeon A3]|nr:MAG: hypothetical protein BWK75_06905 [Candidatus Altiarchaeales archaeon A3]